VSYEESLVALGETRPLVCRALVTAQERRTERLAMLLDGARLKGLEQLHEFLNAAEQAYLELPAPAKLAFLVARVRADFETALEATLSGCSKSTEGVAIVPATRPRIRGITRWAESDSSRVLLTGFNGNGQPVLSGCHRACRVVGERARQVRRPVEVKRHRPVGVRFGD